MTNRREPYPCPPTGTPQVKICGLTDPEEAAACVELGVHAIGCIFYPKSPRFVTDEQAGAISRNLAGSAAVVGVFVNASFEQIIRKVESCALDTVQLHGREPAALVNDLSGEGVRVIKTLFLNAAPGFESAADFSAAAYLAECAGGPLPGGNALAWNWETAAGLSKGYPLVLAGGLSAGTVVRAVRAARPDAVDVSSAVEAAPGKKDLKKVKRFLEAVAQASGTGTIRRIFQ